MEEAMYLRIKRKYENGFNWHLLSLKQVAKSPADENRKEKYYLLNISTIITLLPQSSIFPFQASSPLQEKHHRLPLKIQLVK